MPSTGALIDTIARLLACENADKRPYAWIEEPGNTVARTLLVDAGFNLIAVPCDEQGIDLSSCTRPAPKLIYVKPSHQYFTGVTMSLSRRLALLKLAQAIECLVVEDDYDSKFQYNGSPIAAVQSIDHVQNVVYIGTFSKVVSPGLRVAYAILPHRLIEPMLTAQRLRGLTVSIHLQTALASFVAEGHLRAHIRRMNVVYEAKMAQLRTALIDHGQSQFDVADGNGGLQLAAWFKDCEVNDFKCAEKLSELGFGMAPLSKFHLSNSRPGLLFGV